MNRTKTYDELSNTRSITDSLGALGEALEGADPTCETQLYDGTKQRKLHYGRTALEVSSRGTWYRPVFSVERRSMDRSRFDFSFSVFDPEGQGEPSATAYAYVWVGNQAWKLMGLVDRSTMKVDWMRATMIDTDIPTNAEAQFADTRGFDIYTLKTASYDIAEISGRVADQAVGSIYRERMSEVMAAASAVNAQLNRAVDDVTTQAAYFSTTLTN